MARLFARHGQADLTIGAITPTLFAFALPTLVANLIQSLNGGINAVWVGRLLGEAALAATTNANLMMFLVFAISFGFSMALTVMIGQQMGRRDMDGVRRLVGAGIGLFLLMGTGTAIGGWFGAPAILRLLAPPPEVLPLALAYVRISFLALPVSLMIFFLQSCLRGTGDATTPLLLSIPGMIVDVTLNPVLILGLSLAPRMGIAGSATAALIANVVVLIAMIGYVYARDLPIRLRGAEWRYLVPPRTMLGAIVRTGLPMGLQMVLGTAASLAMVGLINRLGTVAIAGYGAANQLWTYVQMPAFAVSAAVSMMVAQNIGAGRWDRVDGITRSGVMLNVMLTGGLVLGFTLADRVLLGWFLGDAAAAIAVARHVNLLAGWGFVLSGAAMVLGAAPRANGAVLVPFVIMLVSLIPGRVGLAIILEPQFGADGIWWSLPSSYVLSLVLTTAYYRGGRWRKNVLIAVRTSAVAKDAAQAETETLARSTINGG